MMISTTCPTCNGIGIEPGDYMEGWGCLCIHCAGTGQVVSQLGEIVRRLNSLASADSSVARGRFLNLESESHDDGFVRQQQQPEEGEDEK